MDAGAGIHCAGAQCSVSLHQVAGLQFGEQRVESNFAMEAYANAFNAEPIRPHVLLEHVKDHMNSWYGRCFKNWFKAYHAKFLRCTLCSNG